jgi:hypothetical protein
MAVISAGCWRPSVFSRTALAPSRLQLTNWVRATGGAWQDCLVCLFLSLAVFDVLQGQTPLHNWTCKRRSSWDKFSGNTFSRQ